MATEDLGSIKVESGSRPPVQGVGTADIIGEALSGVGEIVKAVGEHKVNKKREDFNEVVDAELSAGQSEQAAPILFNQDDSLDPGANKILNEITRLETIRDRATGSRRAKVDLQLRSEAEKLRSSWPGLADELQTELASFQALDPEYAALALLDVQNKTIAADAQAQLDIMRTFAYTDLGDDGLGLIPTVHIWGSPEFARAASSRSKDLNDRIMKENARLNVEAGDKEDARTNSVQMSSYMKGKSSPVRHTIQAVGQDMHKLAAAFASPTAPGSAELLAAFDAPGGVQFQLGEAIAQAKLEVQTVMRETFPVSQRDEIDFANAQSEVNEYLSVLDSLQEGIQTGDASMVNAYNQFIARQDIEFNREQPVVARTIRSLNRMAPILTAMDDGFGQEGAIVRDTIAQAMDNIMPAVLGRMEGITDHGALPSGALSTRQVLDHYRYAAVTNPDKYGHGVTTPEGNLVGANQEMRNLNHPDLAKAAKDGVLAPDIATDVVGYRAFLLDESGSQGVYPDDVLQDNLAAAFADGTVETAFLADNRSVVRAFADRAEQTLNRYDERRFDTYKSWQGTDLVRGVPAGLSIWQVIEMDVDSIEDGKVKFRVNKERLRALLPVSSEDEDRPLLNKALGVVLPQIDVAIDTIDRSTALSRAEDMASFMTTEVSEDLNIKAGLQAVKEGSKDKDFEAAWEFGGFAETFGTLEEEGE